MKGWANTLVLLAAGGCWSGVGEPAAVEVRLEPFHHQVSAEGVLEAAKVTPVSVPSEVQGSVRLAWLAHEGRVGAGDLVARFDDRPFRERLADAGTELESTDLETTKTRAMASSRRTGTSTKREIAELELEGAEAWGAKDDELFSRREIIESAIDAELATERRRHAVADADTDERLADAELAVLAVRGREANRRGDEARQGLAALEVRAPHDGVFVPARSWRGEPLQVGHELWQGQPVGEIPDLSVLRARVYVLEADAGGISPGVRADVVVEARPDQVLAATVESVEPVAKPRLRGSPVQFFGVVLALDGDSASAGRPGQRLRARLHLAELDQALAVPRQAVLRDNGATSVLVLGRAGTERRPVELGPSSLGRVVVSSGLSAGERIVVDAASLIASDKGHQAEEGRDGAP